jgi:hypothetical protein
VPVLASGWLNNTKDMLMLHALMETHGELYPILTAPNDPRIDATRSRLLSFAARGGAVFF